MHPLFKKKWHEMSAEDREEYSLFWLAKHYKERGTPRACQDPRVTPKHLAAIRRKVVYFIDPKKT